MAQQKYDVNEPSRRRLLKGIGALGGALAITGGCPVAHAAKAKLSGHAVTGRAQEAQPFYGRIRRAF
jgi:deferrochelatase/peroxidase EfeB